MKKNYTKKSRQCFIPNATKIYTRRQAGVRFLKKHFPKDCEYIIRKRELKDGIFFQPVITALGPYTVQDFMDQGILVDLSIETF